MPYIERTRTWTKKATVVLTVALILNPLGAVVGWNSNTVKAEEANPLTTEWERVDNSNVQMDPFTVLAATYNDPDLIEPFANYNVSQPIVISKVFGGGSQNADALYKYDFIELYNPTDSAIDITGWSVQYAVSSSKSDSSSWMVTPLTGMIPAKGYYLVQEAAKSVLPVPDLPTPNVVGSIDLDNKDGKVALVSSTTALSVMNPMAPVPDASLIDFVGYGAAQSYNGSGTAPTPSAQKAIVRKAEEPDQAIGVASIIGTEAELYGNGWNTQDNKNDFDIGTLGTFEPRNATSLTPLAVKVDSSNQPLQMESLKDISSTNNQFAVSMTTGVVKDGDLAVGDYKVSGLPMGISVTRAVGDSANRKVMFTLGGAAVSDVTTDIALSVIIRKSAIVGGAYDDSRSVKGITLQSNTPKVKGQVISNVLTMTEPTKVSGSFAIQLTTGTVKDGSITDTNYTITGLPNGLSVEALGDSISNTVTFTLHGTTISPVIEASPLSVTLKASVVTSGATIDSDPMTGITLDRYKTPVQADEARKAMLTQRIKEANSYYNNPDNKSYKYSQDGMAGTVASFYRGSPYMIYQDLGTVIPLPQSWKDLTNVKTWIEGDAHVGNVGFYDDKFGNIIFDLNDFDGAYIAPFYLDLLRMTSSLYLTRDSENMADVTDADIRDMAKDMLDQYMVSLQSLVGNNNKNTSATKLDMNSVSDGFTKTLMTKLAKKTQLDHLIKWTVPTSDGKHSTGVLNVAGKSDKYRQPTAAERAEVEQNWQTYVSTLSPDFMNAKLAENANYFTIKDVAVRIYQGLGSIGSQRYNVLIEGPTTSHDDDIILDVKQASTPDMFENSDEVQTTPYDTYPGGNGARVKAAYEEMSLDADEFLGYFESADHDFFVHKISLYKGDYEDAPGGAFKTKANLADYVSYLSKSYAYAHARSAEYADDTFERSVLDQVYNDSEVWNNFQTVLLNLGEDYYQQVKADYGLMKQDMIDGKLIDVATLNGLTLSEGSLSPVFDENKLSYTASVKSDVTSIDVTASALDSEATFKIKGVTQPNGTPISIGVSTGVNVIDVVVTAQDGTTKQTYTVTVTRQAASGSSNDNSDGSNGSGSGGSSLGTTTKPNEEVNETADKGSTIVIDAVKLNAELKALQSSGQTEQHLVFNAPSGGDKDVYLQLPLALLEQTSKTMPNVMLILNTGVASYTLPIQAIDFTSLAKELGVPTVASTLTIRVSQLTGPKANAAQVSLATADLNATSVPVAFTIQADSNGKKVEITDFGNHYVSSVIPYDSNASVNELVVVRLNADGTVSFIPATFSNGNATMHSLNNGVYVVTRSASRTFTDIAKHWARADIELLAGKRLVQGTSAQTFSPNTTMTRAEFTMLLSKAFALNNVSARFSDVSQSAWYEGAVGAAYQAGIVAGFEDGSFGPNKAITREQMAVMIVKAAALAGKPLQASNGSSTLTVFKDASKISAWAQDAVEACRQAGIIQGDQGNFSPQDAVTRAQAAVMFKQLLQAIQFIN